MDILKGLVDLIGEQGQQIIEAIAYIVLGASLIVKIVPTLDKDNRILPLIKFIGKFLALDKYSISDDKRPEE